MKVAQLCDKAHEEAFWQRLRGRRREYGIAKGHGYKGYFSMERDSPGDPYAGIAGLIEKTLKNLS